MKKIFSLVLENPMDLVLAHKGSIKAGELLGLSISLQTSFTTAISEAARVIFDGGFIAELSLNVEQSENEYFFIAFLNCNNMQIEDLNPSAFNYAKRLVKEFTIDKKENDVLLTLQIAIPRSVKISADKIKKAIDYFTAEKPENAYEAIKRQNTALNRDARIKEAELEEVRQINKQKNEFLAIASHELKTPIAIIKGFSQLAIMTANDSQPELKDFIIKIDQQAGKINSLITQLLDISKIEAGQLEFNLERVSINDYFKKELESFKIIYPHHQIDTYLDNDFFVMIDVLRMEQVISNLLSNATKYSEKGTAIEVRSEPVTGNYILFSIKDQGIGMDAESAQKIFDKFYRIEKVTKKYSGLGMGLYIASKIITEHGGKIWLESEEATGSTFYFTLPRID